MLIIGGWQALGDRLPSTRAEILGGPSFAFLVLAKGGAGFCWPLLASL